MIVNKVTPRILMLSWEYPPHIEGGLGRHVAELAPALARQGIDVHVVTPVGEPTVAQLRGQTVDEFQNGLVQGIPGEATVVNEDGVIVHRVFTHHKNTPTDIYSRVTEVNRVLESYVSRVRQQYGPCGLIHNHDWLTAFAGIAIKQKWNCTLVSTIHATERGRARGHLTQKLQYDIDQVERDLIRQSDKVIVCSRHMCRELQTFFQTPVEKMAVVPNGVDVAALQAVPDNGLEEFRARFAAPDDKLVFSIARLVFEKGMHRLVDAAPQVLPKCPNTKIVIAGKGPEAERLKEQANYLGVADHVSFIGFVSDEERDQLFKVADCAVFPSLYEPFGIVALEAMALGCPVVVSDVGGFSEVVTHNFTGTTVFPDNPESIAWGIIHTLSNPAGTQNHVENAKKWVAENFTWNRVAQLTGDVYQTVIGATLKST
ncbi:MAG: glycosyltransferase family 1 protein [Chloroflexi bacterium]|nr:MAG: glycosyltransferase family 1 protein [Chloroflexota bacterium]